MEVTGIQRNKIIHRIKQVLCLLLFFALIFDAEAQDCLIKNNKAKKKFNEAIESLSHGKKSDGYRLLIETLDIEPEYVEAHYELANINYTSAFRAKNDIQNIKKKDQHYNRAIEYFQNVIAICPSYENYNAYFYLGELAYKRGYFNEARVFLQDFIDNASKDNRNRKSGQRMIDHIYEYYDLINNPVDFKPLAVEGVCTPVDEYLPMISPDGQFAFYTQRFTKQKKGSHTEDYVEQLTVRKRENDVKSKDLIYSKGEAMPNPFNTGQNQGGVAVTIDNRFLYITI